jgi:hypothetical protein
MSCIWLDGSKGFKKDMDFVDINKVVGSLIDEENQNAGMHKPLSNPYH